MAISIDGIDYQLRLIALLVRHDDFLRTARASIKVEWFESEELQAVVRAVLDFYDAHKSPPSQETLRIWLREYADSKDKDEDYGTLVDSIVNSASGGDLSFVQAHYQEFVAYKCYRRAIIAGAKALDDRSYGTIPELIRRAQIDSAVGFGGLDYFESPIARISKVLTRETITSGIRDLDDVLGGGHARKELTVVMAPPGRGKTLFLINLGYAALAKGLCVLHLFAEQSQELIASRYDNRILRCDRRRITDRPKLSALGLQEFEENKGGRLYITDCRNWTVEKIKSYAYQVERMPDVIIVDYADKLVSDRRYNEYRHEITRIYNDLITLARDFNASVLTASQTNRAALSKSVIKLDDIAESFGKTQDADNILALCQTEKEEQSNDMRIFTAKVRNEQSKRVVHCKVFYDQMRVISRVSHVEGL